MESIDYSILENRLLSFRNWLNHRKSEDIAEAGFFYLGENDKVRCFACNGGLKGWTLDDDPWEEHALWYGKECMFIKLEKGDVYIKNVQDKYNSKCVRSKLTVSSRNCIQTENHEQHNKNLCKICFTHTINVILSPCMHITVCNFCSIKIENCPICRKFITKKEKVYFS